MQDIFDIKKFDEYKEDNRREVKKATNGLPVSLWDTYSSFANSYGGVIILGVKENKDGSWATTGLKDERKLLKDFWDTINNTSKVSINLLKDKDVEVYTIDEDIIIVIYVPRANRELRPVYINGDMFKGTFKRTHEGDYHCTPLQVKSLLRDQTETTMDMAVLDDVPMEYLCNDTIQSYRNRHRVSKPGHPWISISDEEFLKKIGAAALGSDGELHPTGAGLLMFGEEYNIVRSYPEYFLDYRELLDPTTRWSDRLESSSGEWTGNLFDFYFRVYNKLIKDVKTPFKMVGGDRVDDTPVHKALREVLANCLVNTDFFVPRGIVIKKEFDTITIENPGSIRVGKYQMREGGESDPRNKALMKMFNLIDIGERAGSGIPELFDVWSNEGWEDPIIEERLDGVERTKLSLSFMEKATKKSDEKKATKKSDEKKITTRTQAQIEAVLANMVPGKWYRSSDLMGVLEIKETRTKELLRLMVKMGELVDDGSTKGKRYQINNKETR